MKRLIPILLCLVMLLGLLPTAAFAAESITNTTIHLTLESSTMPWYNAQILSAADMIGKISVDSPYSDKVSIYSAEWYTDTDAPAGGKFETLKNYYLLLHLSAKSGYNFTDTGTIRVEGRVPTGLTEPAYLESYKSETTTVTSSAGGIDVKLYFRCLTKVGSFDEALTDSTIGLIPILTAPTLYDSMTAGDVKFQRDTSGHNAFNIDPNSYEVYTGNGNKMDKTAKLELEHYYKVRMTLKMIAPGECFLWSANPVPTVESPNGPDDAVIVGRTADGDPIVEYTYKTPCHRKYESLTLTGIKAPVNGEKPSPSAPSLTGTGTDLDTALHAWIDVNNDRLMGADDLFHIGQTYRAVYEITTKRSTVDLMITGPAAVTVNAGTAIAVSGQFDFGTQHDTTEGVFVTVEFTASAEPTAVALGTYTYDMTEGPAPFNEGGNTEAMFWLYLAFGEVIGSDGNDNYDLDKDGNLDVGQYEEDGKKYIKRLDSANLKGTYVIHALPEMVTACQNGKVDYYSSLSFVFSKESSYNVHFEMNGHGQQLPDQIVQAGQRVIEWNAQPEAHWFLVGWYTDPAFMNRYVFSAPVNSDLTLYAKWINLVDVEKSNYFCEPVEWAVYQEVTNGVDATHFAPGQTCTRGQVVTFLWRAKGCPAPALTENPFNDVQESNFFYKAVLWAVEHGITTGTSADTFSPSSGCTRAQVVAFLWRTEGKPVPTSSENPFTDVPTGKYYTDAVLWAVEKEITKGTAADKFSPDNVCTRGQIVTFLYRAFGPKG